MVLRVYRLQAMMLRVSCCFYDSFFLFFSLIIVCVQPTCCAPAPLVQPPFNDKTDNNETCTSMHLLLRWLMRSSMPHSFTSHWLHSSLLATVRPSPCASHVINQLRHASNTYASNTTIQRGMAITAIADDPAKVGGLVRTQHKGVTCNDLFNTPHRWLQSHLPLADAPPAPPPHPLTKTLLPTGHQYSPVLTIQKQSVSCNTWISHIHLD